MASEAGRGMRLSDGRPLAFRLLALCRRVAGSVAGYVADLLLVSRVESGKRRTPLSMALFVVGGLAVCSFFTWVLSEVGPWWRVPFTGLVLTGRQFLAAYVAICVLCLALDYKARAVDGRGVGPVVGLLSASQPFGVVCFQTTLEVPSAALACVALTLGLTAGLAWLRRRGGAWALAAMALYCFAASSFGFAAFVRYGMESDPVYATSGIEMPEGVADTLEDAASTAREEIDCEPVSDLDDQAIVDLGQRYAHVEAARLNIAEPEVVMSDVAGIRGYYRKSANQIVLSRSGMVQQNEDDYLIIAETVCHEMAHAYQCAVLDQKVEYDEVAPFGEVGAEEVEQWRDEFREAPDPLREPERYAALANERRAVQYSNDEVNEFMWVLVCKPWL